jgi:hypothetical protein
MISLISVITLIKDREVSAIYYKLVREKARAIVDLLQN